MRSELIVLRSVGAERTNEHLKERVRDGIQQQGGESPLHCGDS